jgi:hypothetical protein
MLGRWEAWRLKHPAHSALKAFYPTGFMLLSFRASWRPSLPAFQLFSKNLKAKLLTYEL